MNKSVKKTKEKFVTTINGEELPISKCRKYESGFYKIGDVNVENSGDCYLMENGSYYRFDTGQIVFDHYNKRYVQKQNNLLLGIIDENLNEGYFSKNIEVIKVELGTGEWKRCLNSETIIKNLNFREKLSTGDFHHISRIEATEFTKKIKPSQDYKYSLPYDSKNVMEENIINYDKNYKPSITLNNEQDILKILQDLSFGLEFETIKGQIPRNICAKLGLIPLRDGSIAGLEYVTIPLSGVKGISNVYDVVKELKLRTDYDFSCSLHLHLGGMPRTPEFITAFTKLTLAIQDEIFSMFYLYKKYNFRYKNKNYSAPFDTFKILSNLDPIIDNTNIFRNFNYIFTELSEGESLVNYGDDGSLSKVNHHPKDPSGNQKWNIHSRYHIHNIVPLIFGNKKTIEFRIHTPTYDINKIVAFILLNSILVNYAIKNEKLILTNKIYSFKLENIIMEYCEQLGVNYNFTSNLLQYFSERKRLIEDFNRRSEVNFEESKIPCYFDFNRKEIQNLEFRPSNRKSSLQGISQQLSQLSQLKKELHNPYISPSFNSYYSNIKKEEEKKEETKNFGNVPVFIGSMPDSSNKVEDSDLSSVINDVEFKYSINENGKIIRTIKEKPENVKTLNDSVMYDEYDGYIESQLKKNIEEPKTIEGKDELPW